SGESVICGCYTEQRPARDENLFPRCAAIIIAFYRLYHRRPFFPPFFADELLLFFFTAFFFPADFFALLRVGAFFLALEFLAVFLALFAGFVGFCGFAAALVLDFIAGFDLAAGRVA